MALLTRLFHWSQSEKLAAKLAGNDVSYIYVPFEGQFHAFDFFKDTSRRSLYFVELFLNEYLPR